MLRRIENFLQNEKFCPHFIGLFINPFYFARKALNENITAFSRCIKGDVLDIGCGQKPYRKLFSGVTSYSGLEIDSAENRLHKQADIFYNGKRFPFENGRFDSAIAIQVFEHIFNPDDFLNEIYRILKPEGIFLMTVPLVWDEHEQPYDYARYSSFGLRSILTKHGFEVLESRKSLNDLRIIFQLLNAYLYKVFWTKNPYFNLAFALILVAPLNILGSILRFLLPKNNDLYLDNIVLARKVRI